MKSVAVAVLILGFAALTLAQEKPKACIKASDECDGVKNRARGLFGNLRALETETAADIPLYINQLHELFNLTLQNECTINVCKCKDGALECSSTREDIRNNILQKLELPECLGESEKATALLTSFKKAVADGNRDDLLRILDDLHKAITAALAKGDNEKTVTCITKTVQHIRGAVKTRLQKSDFQPNCDFCVAPEGTADKPAILGAVPA